MATGFARLPTTARSEQPFRWEATPGRLPKSTFPVTTPVTAQRTFTGKARSGFDARTAATEIVLNALALEIDSAVLVQSTGTRQPLAHRLDPER